MVGSMLHVAMKSYFHLLNQHGISACWALAVGASFYDESTT